MWPNIYIYIYVYIYLTYLDKELICGVSHMYIYIALPIFHLLILKRKEHHVTHGEKSCKTLPQERDMLPHPTSASEMRQSRRR